MSLFDRIITSRGLSSDEIDGFLNPVYSDFHDPFLLNGMSEAVERIITARKRQQKIIIYGDYDIDGLTASALLLDALTSFGFKNVEVFIPNRFTEGYGLTIDAVEDIAAKGFDLIITVDCGSSSIDEVGRANELNIDVIVTDHHSVGKTIPPAIAVINPKRQDNNYPFIDLAGVGVAFKLVQALQTKLEGLEPGQEKWLLDLVALGTVCDVVNLVDENRTNVFFGLKVLAKTKRLGLKALMAVSAVDINNINSRSLGFRLGPRMNAAGRLETAQHSFDMLVAKDPMIALEKVEYLDALNKSRRLDQEKIIKQATAQAELYSKDPVLVVSGEGWNHGIVGIVAARLLELFKKPTFVLQEIGDHSKGSARSYGDFSAIDAIDSCRDLITKGGGHQMAAGITLPTKNIKAFRDGVNSFYEGLKLVDQKSLLLPKADAIAELEEIDEDLVDQISQLEPFGRGNLQPIIKCDNMSVIGISKMGSDAQHMKFELKNKNGKTMKFLAFNAPDYFSVEIGDLISVWFHPDINEWRGSRTVEGQLLHLDVSTIK